MSWERRCVYCFLYLSVRIPCLCCRLVLFLSSPPCLSLSFQAMKRRTNELLEVLDMMKSDCYDSTNMIAFHVLHELTARES